METEKVSSDVQNIEMSASVGELFAALSKAQGKIDGAKKDSVNPHFKSKYADLASVWDACRAQLTESQLCVVQTTRSHGNTGICVVTTLGHSSGQWIRGELFIPATKADAQGFVAGVTYARRAALAAMVGIAPEDDDGNAISVPPPQRGPLKSPQSMPPTREQQAEQLPQQLGASVDLLERAVDANEMLASARTMGELNEAWVLAADLRKRGLPNKHFDSLKALKDKRKSELSGGTGAAAE